MERFNSATKGSADGLERMGKSITALRGSGSAIGGLVKKMEELDRILPKSGASPFDKMAGEARLAEGAASALTRTLREGAEAAALMAGAMAKVSATRMPRMPGGAGPACGGAGRSGHSAFNEHNLTMAGLGAGIAGGFMLDGVKHVLTPAIDLNRTQDVLASDTRLSPTDLTAALARAWVTP